MKNQSQTRHAGFVRAGVVVTCSAVLAGGLVAAVLAAAGPAAGPTIPPSPLANVILAGLAEGGAVDPTKVVGVEACAKCHEPAFKSWELMAHAKTWDEMHKRPAAKTIMDGLGLTGSIKRNDVCLSCHYTSQVDGDKVKPFAGVTCESCHGGAKDWLDIHNNYGGDGITRDKETAENRTARWRKCDDLGMIRKDRVELIAENCYSCHTVPNEDLVNKGGHKAGSDFELVAWSQGEVRHNFLENDKTNRKPAPERLRVLYVVGKLVEFQVSLQNLATVDDAAGEFMKQNRARANQVMAALDKINAAVAIPEVTEALAAVPRVTEGDKIGNLKVGKVSDLKALSESASKVKSLAAKFTQAHDGKALGAIDPLLPSESQYKGTAHNP